MKKNRTTCRTCGNKLQTDDPQRRQKVVKNGAIIGYTWSFTGECKQCSSDRVITNKWKKRSESAITKAISENEHNIKILNKILEEKQNGKK